MLFEDLMVTDILNIEQIAWKLFASNIQNTSSEFDSSEIFLRVVFLKSQRIDVAVDPAREHPIMELNLADVESPLLILVKKLNH